MTALEYRIALDLYRSAGLEADACRDDGDEEAALAWDRVACDLLKQLASFPCPSGWSTTT